MNNMLTRFLSRGLPEPGEGQHDSYRIIFLHSVFLLAGVLALGMGFVRWQASVTMGIIDFVAAALNFFLLAYMHRNRDRVERVGSIALALYFGLFFALYILATSNAMRLSLFFLLAAAAFFLKGRKAGRIWLLVILLTIVTVHFLPYFATGYSNLDIFTTCLYLIGLFFILEKYEMFKESQNARDGEQEVLRQTEERLRHALEGAGDAVWAWELQTGEVYYSRRFTEMLGYAEVELGGGFDQIFKAVHPNDAPRVSGELQAYLTQNAGHFASEMRMGHQGGGWKWLLCRGMVTRRSQTGEPVQLVGTFSDITERKQGEERLRLTAKVFENTLEGIVISDSNNNILEVNDAYCKITGYAREELIGKSPRILQSGRQSADFYKAMWKTIAEIGHWRGEVWNRKKDGELVAELLTISTICDAEGKVSNYVGITSDITHLKQHEKQLEHIAHYDALTGVPNRILLADRLRQALAHSKREETILAVCYLDLDGFKHVNDTMGHEAGDKVLVEVTRRIKKTIRGDDTVARLGGDEFAVLLLGLHAPEECLAGLGRLLEVISQPIEIKGREFEVSASIGVALYPDDDCDADTLLRHADQAMYTAKQSGKNRYNLYDAESEQRARSHHDFLRRLVLALEKNEFELYYQPKVDMRTCQLAGAEALIRWKHPERGLLSPSEFLPAVEGTTLEIALGDWVVTTALAQLERWHQAGLPLELSINISARQLQANDFAWKLKRKMLRHPDLAHGCLQIEVLETAALEDIPRVSDTIERCRKIGISFALDDFGTGYSSLSYLGRLPVDVLKIDQSFIFNMLQDQGDRAIVQGVIALAKTFDRKIVAEGVETEELFRALLEMGCEYGQGYGIASPMPADALPVWLERWNSAPFNCLAGKSAAVSGSGRSLPIQGR